MRKLICLAVILFATLAIGQNLPNISTGTKGQLPVGRLQAGTSGTQCLFTDSLIVFWNNCASGSGSVTNFSIGNLSPLFTSNVTNPTTTPSATFSLSNAGAHTFFGNTSGSTGPPSYSSITAADLPGVFAQSKTNVLHKWINSYDSTTGLFTQTQIDYSDLTGTPVLPANTTATASQFFTAYNSGTGAFTKAAILAGDVPTLNQNTSGNASTSSAFDHTPTLCSAGNYPLGILASGAATGCTAAASGTVTSVSSGNFSPLFTVSIATPTTTPAFSFAASNFAAHTFFGNNTAGSAVPGAQAIGNGDLPGLGAITLNTTSPLGGGGAVSLGGSLTFTCPGCLTSVTGHNLLSATHPDTTAHAVLRGDLIAGIGAVPTWAAVAKGGTNTYPKWNSSGDVIPSTLAAAGIGTPTACSNQFVTGFTLNADAVATSTCTSATLASAQFANQGTINTVLHGNAAGNPAFSAVTSADTAGTFPATVHNLLSATHGDTTAGSVSTGDVISGQSDTWARLVGNSTTTPQYLKSLGSGAAANAPSWAQVAYGDLSGVPSTFAPTPHNILSASHSDTTTASLVRGDGLFAIGATPTLQRLAHPATTGAYFKWNGTDIVASSLAASGTGNCSANQFETGDNGDAAPTCAQPAYAGISGTPAVPTGTGFSHVTAGVLDSASKLVNLTASTDVAANQGTTTTLLHGNAAGQASFASVVSGDLNLTTTTCTNQFVSAISAGGVGTCTTDTLASAQHANQGTTTTVLHGNAAGNPSFSAVTSADTTGTFASTPHALLDGSVDSDTAAGTVARGDVITGQSASAKWTRLAKGTASQCLQMDGSAVDIVWGSCGAGGGVSSVSGTANQITSTGGTTPILALANPLIFPGEATYATATTGAASTTTPSGTAPTTPVAGDYWRDGNGFNFIESTTTNGTVDVRSDQAGAVGAANTVRYTADSNVAKTSVNAGALEFNNLAASALTANQIVLGNGNGETKALGSLGTTATLLHGNVSGVPAFSAVVPSTDCPNCADKTTSNTYSVSTTQDMDTARAKYWGGAPVFDAFEQSGTDMCDKIAAVLADSAFTAVASAVIDARGFTGDQNCATSNPFATTHSTKWIFNPGLHVHLTRSAFTLGPATSSLLAAPAAPTLATATTGGSLAAATTYGVKVELRNLSGPTTPSAEATKLTGAGATNSITVTSPTVAFPASTGAVCYDVFSATPVGSGWKKNNLSGCIALGTNYVIQTVGTGAIPDATNLAANDQYEVDFGGSTWSIESNTALILAAVNNTYFHDLTLVNSTTLDNGVANAYVNSNISHVVFERITSAGGRIGFAINNGDTDIRFSNLRWGNPTVGTGGQVGIYVTSGGGTTPSNIVVDGFELLPSVLNTTAFISAGILTNPCNDCTIQRVRCTNVDMSLSAFGGCVEIGGNNTPTGGSTNIHVINVFCDTLIWMDCVAVNSFSSNVTIDDVTFKNSNTVAGINGLTTFQQGDCLDIFMVSNINVTNVLCQNLNTLSHTLPSVEIFDTQEVSLTNVKALDSAAGIKLFGAPSTHLNNVATSRNWNTGYLIIDYNALVTCNGTTAVVFVSGPGGFGPWVAGTAITINGVAHQIASVTDGTHLTTAANCASGASVTMLMPSTDVSIANPKADDNGTNATGTGSRTGTSEGIFVSGGSQITILGGSANDNKATASKTQQYGLRLIGTARARIIGFDASNNVGAVTAPCTGVEYGANVAGNHAICDDVKTSAVFIDDNVTNQWTLASQQTLGSDNKFGQTDIVASSAAINTTETVIVKTPALPANRLIAGTHVRIILDGTCTSTVANVSTFTVRWGTAGTTADGTVAALASSVAATSGTNNGFRAVIDVVVRVPGASATSNTFLQLTSDGNIGIVATPNAKSVAGTAFNTTTALGILSVAYKSAATTTTSTFTIASIEIVDN